MEFLLNLLLWIGELFLDLWGGLGMAAERYRSASIMGESPMDRDARRFWRWVAFGVIVFLGGVACVMRLKFGHWPDV